MKITNGYVTTPGDYKACGIRCGLKQKGKDLALVVSDVPAAVGAMFTTNPIVAAPVLLSRQNGQNHSPRKIQKPSI